MTLSRPDDLEAEELPIRDREIDISTNLEESAHSQAENAEFSGMLESSVPLEAPRLRYVTVPNPATSVRATDEGSRSISESESQATTTPATLVNQLDEVVIPLMEERLVVARQRRKVGEIVVRKEIETHIVEVPIRREKLIVERVSPEYQQIAVVELGQAPVTEFDTPEAVEVTSSPTVSGEFANANAAIDFLTAIASESSSSLQKVQIRVVLKDAARQTTYQGWLERYSTEVTL